MLIPLLIKGILPLLLSFLFFSPTHAIEPDGSDAYGLTRRFVHPINKIPTFHIHADGGDLNYMLENVDDNLSVTVDLTRIVAHGVDKFLNVVIKINGQTSRYLDKKSFTLTLPDPGGSINGFRKFKLRSMVTDPSRLREKMYLDLTAALGILNAHESIIGILQYYRITQEKLFKFLTGLASW